jgi:hypothetical protein
MELPVEKETIRGRGQLRGLSAAAASFFSSRRREWRERIKESATSRTVGDTWVGQARIYNK